jgi:hypothetical protein
MKTLGAIFLISLGLILARHLIVEKCRGAEVADLSLVTVRVFTQTPYFPGVT